MERVFDTELPDAWLRHGEEGLRLLAEHTRDVFYVTGPEPLRLLYVSPAYEEVWGRPRESLYADLSSFLEAVHTDDRGRITAAFYRQLQGEHTDEEYRIVRPDGSLRWVRDRAIPVRDDTGAVFRIVGIAADVTDRRRTVEMLELLDEASRLLGSSLDYTSTLKNLAQLLVPALADVCVIDILEGGDRVRRLEVTHADPTWDVRLKALATEHPPRLINESHPLERAIATGAPQLVPTVDEGFLALIEHEPERLRVLRELGLVSAVVVPLVTRGRTLGAITLVTTTRSARRYNAEDLALATVLGRRAATAVDNASLYEAALLANKAKADFLAVVSHELRTPLTAIIGYADLLALGVGGELSELQLTRVERIKSGAWHLVQVIEGILSYTRLETGREDIRQDTIELGRIVRDSASLIEPGASARGIALNVDVPDGAVWTVSDGAKVKQIVLNLLSNAVKFTEVGEVNVTLREEEGAYVIDVKDTGIGIQPEHLARIFDAFWQVEQPHTRTVGGTGLGLSVTRRLANLLGGEVSVVSSPAWGSTFTVHLPRKLPTPAVDDAVAEARPTASTRQQPRA
jgi:PAS domain S-box-containing protein